MEHEDEVGPAMGARPKQTKLPNPLNQPKREREAKRKEERAQQEQVEQEGAEQGEGEQEQGEQGQAQQQFPSKIPSFGDGSQILNDWTTSGLISDPIDQHEDTCGSVVLTSLLQVSYNKDKPIVAHRNLSYQDLAHHVKSKTKKKVFSFRNLNIPINYIRSEGIHKDGKISGPGVRGVKTKGDFGQNHDATRQFVYDMSDITPFGIVIEYFPEFEEIGMGIYHVPRLRTEKTAEHSLLVVARGITNDGVDFLVAQNSWGVDFGNNGYCRLFLPADGSFKIYWPL